ncbi:MAG: delta-60 repeat domain-containing protein, partial [Hymenobacteraceae bacterium]|nr:delta-60 repeat domain-containing protein [Hymenobacteraceae bacterium]
MDARSSDPLSNFWLVRALAAHDGAKILVGGYYDFINGAPAGGVSRLLPTSTPDATYNPGGQGANSMVDALEPLSDGRTLIGGSFSRYNGRAVGYVTRLNADGTPDPTFNPGGTGADGQVLDIQRDRQDRILLAGSFRHYNGQPVGAVTRLLPDGTLDPTFAAPMTNGGVAFSVATDAAGNV